jgi:hypothetical protein
VHNPELTFVELLTRAIVFVVLGGMLLLANIWFVRAALSSFGTRAVVIAPMEVMGRDGPSGQMLASLLQARLQQLQVSLKRAQESLVSAPRGPADTERPSVADDDAGKPGPPMPRFWSEPIRLDAVLFQPIEISASVGGVDVGRLVPWVQRLVAEPQTLNFTVSFEANSTLVAGDIRPLGTQTGSVWISTNDTTPAKIADLIAHELILRQLASHPGNRFSLLDVQEFQVLSAALTDSARLNDRIARGRPVRQELSALLPGLEQLVEKVPNWTDLLMFAATVAENAGSRDRALSFYTRLDSTLANSTSPDDRERRASVTAKVASLRTGLPDDFYTGLGRRIVEVTGVFEVGSDSPERIFGAVTGDFAKHNDIYFGAALWNLRTKTLVPLLREFESADPERFAGALGEGRSELEVVLSGTPDDAAAFAQRIQNDRAVQEPWKSRFAALGREKTFQDIQMRTLEPYFVRAVALAESFGLRSERGLAMTYNIVIQQGGSRVRQQWPAALESFREAKKREPDELERMSILVGLASDRLPPTFRPQIRARFATFAEGKSSAPAIDLEERGIRLRDFRTGEPVTTN